MAKRPKATTTCCSRCGATIDVPANVTGSWSAVCLDCLAPRPAILAARRRKKASKAPTPPTGVPTAEATPEQE